MNSPIALWDPISTYVPSYMSDLQRREFQQISDKRRGYKQTDTYQQLYPHESAVDKVFDTVGSAASVIGSASLFNPVLAPVAAVGGITYGTYKLGKSFGIW